MNKIGFKIGEKAAEKEEVNSSFPTYEMDSEEQLRQLGYQKAFELLQKYLEGDMFKQVFLSKMDMIREMFF